MAGLATTLTPTTLAQLVVVLSASRSMASFLAAPFVDEAPKRTLLVGGTLALGLASFACAVGIDARVPGIAFLGLCAQGMIYNFAVAPLRELCPAEVTPGAARGRILAAVEALDVALSETVLLCVGPVVPLFGLALPCAALGALGLAGAGLISYHLPTTGCKSLEQIEDELCAA